MRSVGRVLEPFPRAWKGTKNGRLLDLLENEGFDCLVTCDKNMEWQQPVSSRRIGILVLPTPMLAELKPIIEDVVRALDAVRSGEISHVTAR
jgi:hypothetical protein